MTATQGPESEARPELPARERVAEYYRTLWGYAEHNDQTWQAADHALEAMRPEIEQLLFERDAAQATADNIAQQLEDLRDDVLGDDSLHVLEVASAAGREVERLTAEVGLLERELAAWTSGRRRKAWPRIESVPDAVYLAAELARSQGTEGGEEHDRLLREASQRLKALHDTAQVLLADRTVLSDLLRGMARKVSDFRQSLKFADAHVPRWDQIISEHKTEIKRLEENEDFLERAVHLVLGCCDASDVPCELLDAEVLYEHVRRGTTPVTREALSGMLRDMARKASAWRSTSAGHYAEFHQAVLEWQHNDEQMLAANQRLAEANGWLAEACRLTVREAAAVRAERDRLHDDATRARQKLMDLVGGDWTVEPSLSDLAHYATRFWGDDRRELAARAEWKQAAAAEAERLNHEQAERRAEVVRLQEQLAAGQALVADLRQCAEQTVAKLGKDGHHECGSPDECHASGQRFAWKLAATALEKTLAGEPAAPATLKPCICNGGWSVDENYQPEDYERNEPLRPEKGLIPCGLCNHGGWDAPWPPETDEVAAPRAPRAMCSDDELVEQTSRRLQRDFRLRIGPNTRRHITDGQELIPLSLRECDDVARAAVTALKKVIS